LGFNNRDTKENVYAVLMEAKSIKGITQKTSIENLELLPSTIELIGAEIELVDMPERESRLKEAIKEVDTDYEFVIIDCPPSLGLLTLNSLTASDSVLIPLQCEYYALEGLTRLLKTIKLVKSSFNPDLRIEGLLLTMYDRRLNLSKQVEEEVRRYFGRKVFNTVIPRSIRLAEAPSFGVTIHKYAPDSAGAFNYLQLAKELENGSKGAW